MQRGLLSVVLVQFLKKHFVAGLSHLALMDLFGTIMDVHPPFILLLLCLSFESLDYHPLKHVSLLFDYFLVFFKGSLSVELEQLNFLLLEVLYET